MTNHEKEIYVARWSKAISRIGGYAGLLQLPEEVWDVLKSTDDLVAKTKMLEAIADAIRK